MSGILVEWEEPLFPNGELEYNITLEQTDFARMGNVLVDLLAVTSETSQFFSLSTIPHALYEATVVPITEAGSGEAGTGSLQTPEESKSLTIASGSQGASSNQDP